VALAERSAALKVAEARLISQKVEREKLTFRSHA
jgi:hypothetical protein